MTSDRRPRSFWVGLAVGLPIVVLGIRGALLDAGRTHPAELARWVAGSAVVHDGVVLPVVLAVVWALRRVLPSGLWPRLRWPLFTSAVVLIVSRPFVAGYGRQATNPSLLPREYGRGVVVALVAVWLVPVVAVIAGRRRSAPPATP